MKISNRNLIFVTILIYFIILNIVMYVPFTIYNLSLNVVDWSKEYRTFYCFLLGGMNISIIFLIPPIYNNFRDEL